MTVDVHTGEIVAHLNAAAARDLTDRIRGGLSVAYDGLVEAWQGRADLALGYDSWDAYCAAEFAEGRMVRVDREQRREIVATMREAGMSTRAIGPALGIDHATAARDLASVASATDGPPSRVASLDGRSRPSTRPPVASSTAEPEDDRTPAAVHPPSPPQGSDPISDAKARVAAQPVILAGKAIERLRIARLTFEAAGGGAAVVADFANDPIGDSAADLWLDELDATAAVLADLAGALRRRHIRSAP